MKRWKMVAALLLISSGVVMQAQEKITVEATNDDISEGLDLKAVATLFGEVKDLNEFEEKLNSPDAHLNNLDINGDGMVDYLRVVEVEDKKNMHLVIIQAVLAKDIFQDVASIYVENKDNRNVTVQVIGDEYIYGKNYVIEPVYIYRPIIYDWFWGPTWVCYSSPWYWGYWPGWYAPYPCWGYRDYWVHVHVYHYDHPRCSYRYARSPHEQAAHLRQSVGRSDYARANSSRSFASRTGMSSARELTNTTNARASASYGSHNTSASRTIYSNGATSYSSGTRSATVNSSSSAMSRGTSGASRGSSYSTTAPSSNSRTSSGASYTTSSRGSYSNSGTTSSYSPSRSSASSYSGGSSRGSSYSGGSSSFSSGSRGSAASSGSRR